MYYVTKMQFPGVFHPEQSTVLGGQTLSHPPSPHNPCPVGSVSALPGCVLTLSIIACVCLKK